MDDTAGSSPHTRGLLDDEEKPGMAVRIIPAHAGFTRSCSGRARMIPDHPRTRGVYHASRRVIVFTHGSSPHTRGLPERVPLTLTIVRIIPAHAGFTTGTNIPLVGVRDHPRTRGVYQRLYHGCAWSHRIIPAHAGFTVDYVRNEIYEPDHPRTRGVYVLTPVLSVFVLWIIPAHAGFT